MEIKMGIYTHESSQSNTAKQERETAEQTAQDNYINSWERVRAERDNLLKDTDKYLLTTCLQGDLAFRSSSKRIAFL